MSEVRVNLPAGDYSIHIGPSGIEGLGGLITGMNFTAKALVISDSNVGALYGEKTLISLRNAGFDPELATVPSGEASKALAVAGELFSKAITRGLDRQSPIVALGGGVVGDLTGFVAATYLRGVPFIQVPTSLLAQVDSSVGGKVAVNHPLGKNLIGAFYQPRLVVADIDALVTLPQRELATGLAEVVKHGVIADAAFFDYLEENSADIIAKDDAAMTEIVRRSCEIKARVVEQDEKESYFRMVLNFGHTIGHAVEASGGYGRYTHGEAVAIGIHGASLISHYLGLCSARAVDRVRVLLERFGLPVTAENCRPDDLAVFLGRDKKSVGGAISWILLNDIGVVKISNQVPDEVIRRVLHEIT